MNAFVGKSHYLGIFFFVLGLAIARAQAPASITTGIYAASIDASDDRSTLFEMINTIKNDFGVVTKFQNYEFGRQGLTSLELEFTTQDGSSQVISASNPNGIEAQILKIDATTKKILYAGSQKVADVTLPIDAVSNKSKETLGSAEKASTSTTTTYSITSKTVTDPSALSSSQIDRSGPKEITAAQKAQMDAREAQEAARADAEQKAEMQKQKLEQEAAFEKAQAKAKKDAAQQLVDQKALEIKQQKALAESKRLEDAAQELQRNQALQKAAEAKAAQELKEQQASMESNRLQEAEEDAKKRLASQQVQQEKAAQLTRERLTSDTTENLPIKTSLMEEEAETPPIENDLRVKGSSKPKPDSQKQTQAMADDDAASMKQTIEELKKIQKEQTSRSNNVDIKGQGFVFINAQQYNYEVYKSRTLIYDSMERTVLVIPGELDDRPVSGTTTINGLRFNFNYKNNIMSITNGAGEIVGLDGKAL